jgi:arabinan endo-1,5-alpha-L-arabinosidase
MRKVAMNRHAWFRILTSTIASAIILWSGIARAASKPEALKLAGDIAGAHDPSMIIEGETYYVFTTGKAPGGGQLAIRCSSDLTHWRFCGQVFDAVPAWIKQRSPGTRDLWAPDISYAGGKYRLYYAYSLFGKNTSGIALATTKTLNPNSPDYVWHDEGLVLESTAADDFNAIDPNYIEDAAHHAWLSFGSFWTGIKMRALDAATGKLSAADTKIYSLASRVRPADAGPNPPGLPGNWQAIEAPFIVHRGGYYYLFASFDLCCRGVKSTYRTVVGRARSITGPYFDHGGVPMLQGGGTTLLSASAQWLGPGGESILLRHHEPDLIVFHAYDHATGKPSLQISTIAWKDGWPAAALMEH